MKKIYILFIALLITAVTLSQTAFAAVDNKNLNIVVNNTELVLDEQKYKYYVQVPYNATTVYLTVRGYNNIHETVTLTDKKTVYNFTVVDETDNDSKTYSLVVIKSDKTSADEEKEKKEKLENFIVDVQLYVVYFVFLTIVCLFFSGFTALIKKIVAALKK
jgi:hypothetical protein